MTVTSTQIGIYGDRRMFREWQMVQVMEILENDFGLSFNDAEKRVRLFFSPGFLPNYFFYSNSAWDIANHLMMLSEHVDANTTMLAIVDDSGRRITYFCNVGTNIPGALLDILRANNGMDIVGVDSIYSTSGYRIVSLQKRYSQPVVPTDDDKPRLEAICERIRRGGNPCAELFLQSLPAHYLYEEMWGNTDPPRIERHLNAFSTALAQAGVHISIDLVGAEIDADRYGLNEKVRVNVFKQDAEPNFVVTVLEAFNAHNINLSRTYFDRFFFPDNRSSVSVLSIYPVGENELDSVLAQIRCQSPEELTEMVTSEHVTEQELCHALDVLADVNVSDAEQLQWVMRLKTLVDEMQAREIESTNFYFNVLTEFFEAVHTAGFDTVPELLYPLLRFESIADFFVESRVSGKVVNRSGYRLRHSSVRGPGKGGLRLHPIADLTEVAALSFMMTWKCAKTRVKLGGGKGGARLNPRDINPGLDYYHTIANFGRSLFLETGSFVDVPAGDVNCGAPEIGMIFDGYKAALRDLISLVYGSKMGAARIGNRVVTLRHARRILADSFGINPFDDEIVHWLMASEEYLSLVLASQITGKPTLGIAARDGATGLGLCYSTLAAVGRLYLAGKWATDEPLDDAERGALETMASLGAVLLADDLERTPVTESVWALLTSTVYPKLFANKRVVVQGLGKVGASLLENLCPYGIRIVGVADASGGLVGEQLDFDELLAECKKHRAVIGAQRGVTQRFEGAANGSAVLEQPCDILFPCALENAITLANASRVDTALIVCGANGPITPKAAASLQEREIPVVYDFLANSAGVTASYFEWLRGLTERFRFEAETIRGEDFDVMAVASYVMPEFKTRILQILEQPESPAATAAWRELIRDIVFAGLNDDYDRSIELGVRLKTAGMLDAVLRVLTATLVQCSPEDAHGLWSKVPPATRELVKSYLAHPEAAAYDQGVIEHLV